MTNYDCAGCGNNLGYENAMLRKSKLGYSGKDDYESGMPNASMPKYFRTEKSY